MKFKSYYAKNDNLINELIKDTNYVFLPSGKVFRHNGNIYRPTGNAKTTKNGKVYRHLKYKGQNLLVHRIIYRYFVGKLQADRVINHIDGNGLNNQVSNLELITRQENRLVAT